MSFIKNFYNEQQADTDKNWRHLTQIEQLDEIVKLSAERPVVIFKHSTRCGISVGAKSRLEAEPPLGPCRSAVRRGRHAPLGRRSSHDLRCRWGRLQGFGRLQVCSHNDHPHPHLHPQRGLQCHQVNSAVYFQEASEGLIFFHAGRDEANAETFHDRVISTGDTHTYEYCIFANSPLVRIVLAWTDAPGFPGASVSTV